LAGVTVPFNAVRGPVALTLSVRLGSVENQWPLWVYPEEGEAPEPSGVLTTRVLDESALEALRAGRKVLLLAHGLKNPWAARTGFESVYWSAGWWGNKFSSLGVLCDPTHPAFKEFPNEGVSNWQWRDLCAGATTFDLTGAPPGFRPIVQPVPDFHYNALLGQVFECKVGKGSLLVCGYDLASNLAQRPAARQFRRSLFHYVASDAFHPGREFSLPWIQSRFMSAGLGARGAKVIYVDSEDRSGGNVAANVLDGDPASFWHTQWQPESAPMPHELIIDLGRETKLRGINYVQRQEQANGRLAKAEVYTSLRREEWGEPAAEIEGKDGPELASVVFKAPTTTRFLRLVVRAEANGQPFAALAELDVIPCEP
jgi:hypothetical protein